LSELSDVEGPEAAQQPISVLATSSQSQQPLRSLHLSRTRAREQPDKTKSVVDDTMGERSGSVSSDSWNCDKFVFGARMIQLLGK
jgi:hypothetical protein